MKRVGLAVMAIVILMAQGQRAFSMPSMGADCASCHSDPRGTMTIASTDPEANPTEGCGSPDMGPLKVFQVTQGAVKTLSATLSDLSPGASYATAIKGFDGSGIERCGTLSFTGDVSWKQRSTYYTQPLSGTFTWPDAATFNFDITVAASTPPDFYDLVLTSAGMDGSGMFHTESHFYVQVIAATAPVNPALSLSKTVLTPAAAQGTNPANDTFTVANGGQGTLNYTITGSVAWLTITPAGGTSTGDPVTHTVQYETASLAAGTHSATITIADASAANNPQTISVSLTVTAAPPVDPGPPGGDGTGTGSDAGTTGDTNTGTGGDTGGVADNTGGTGSDNSGAPTTGDDSNSDAGEEILDDTPKPPAAGICGAGSAALVPALFLGLAGMRTGLRRRGDGRPAATDRRL